LLLGTNGADRITITGSGNVGIGTTVPHASAITELSSTTQGFLPPRLSNTQRNAISAPANGLIIFNTSTGCMNYHFSGTWYEWCGTLVAIVGTIGSLSCASATAVGTLTAGTPAAGVSSTVPYIGGNGGVHGGQTVTSTGVTGLTATLAPGTFANGSGTLIYTISGTPAGSGTASFTLNIGGKTCTLNRTVGNPAVYPPGTVFCNGTPTAVVDVTNPVTGRTWMDRNLGASQAATSLTDTAAYGDLYQWGRGADGHHCRNSGTTINLSSTDQPGHGFFIISPSPPEDWRNPQNTNLWQGINGANNPCPSGFRLPTDIELEAERLSWNANNSAGAFASPLKLPMAGRRSSTTGSLFTVGTDGRYWSSTTSGIESRVLGIEGVNAGMGTVYRAYGFSVRCLKEVIGTIGSLNCGSATVTGNLVSGQPANGVGGTIPYGGGNGGYYATTTITSTGVTGLTATINQDLFANGSGSLTYVITGTPQGSGTASFALSIGGQVCTFTRIINPPYPPGAVFCSGAPTDVVDVTNPITGKTWMDRNLGASQAATSATDLAAYGDLYQWGRAADGHQCRNSPNSPSNTVSSSDQPGNNLFYLPGGITLYGDWRVPQNDNLWQGANGVNNPCPGGYRLPSGVELETERLSWPSPDVNGAILSPLKFPATGWRSYSGGLISAAGFYGYYWSSSVSGTGSIHLSVINNSSQTINMNRAEGFAVRCIKD